jgi:histidine triad (HIT) family protein
MADNCIFCKIANGTIPARIVHQDESVVAFADLNPQAPHHYLLIPRKHIATTLDLQGEDAAILGCIFSAAGEIARKLGFAEDGFRIVNNCNADGGQTVWHLHFHLLGGRAMTWPPG